MEGHHHFTPLGDLAQGSQQLVDGGGAQGGTNSETRARVEGALEGTEEGLPDEGRVKREKGRRKCHQHGCNKGAYEQALAGGTFRVRRNEPPMLCDELPVSVAAMLVR